MQKLNYFIFFSSKIVRLINILRQKEVLDDKHFFPVFSPSA